MTDSPEAPPPAPRKAFLVTRLQAAFRRQDWMAVAIELAVVVFGLFLGLQLNAWKEASDAREREHAALERLAAEAEADVAYLSGRVKIFEELLKGQNAAITALATGDKVRFSPAELAGRLQTLGMFPGIAPPRAVYDELSNSGQINEIGSPSVRTAVAEYYAQLAFIQSQLDFFRLTTSLAFAQPSPGWTTRYNPKGERFAERFEAAADFDTIARDTAQMTKLVDQHASQLKFQLYREDVADSATAMCKALAEALHKACAAATPATSTPK